MRTKSIAVAATAITGSLVLAACGGGPSSAGGKISDDKVVLGLLNDQSGVYKDLSGPNSKVAIQMAIDDYKAKYGDKAVAKTIEIVQADHQNKPDIANTKAQEMYDRDKADIILDVPTSSAARMIRVPLATDTSRSSIVRVTRSAAGGAAGLVVEGVVVMRARCPCRPWRTASTPSGRTGSRRA